MPHPEQPSYEELAARNAELLAVVAEQAALIESLRAEVAALRRQAGRDSSNSSQPPGQDGPAAEAKKKAGQREARRARPGRPQGGQKGHPGASLAWAARPDETLAVEPGTCGGCGADLADAEGRIAAAVQVFDIPAAALTVTEYQMMCRECGCGQVTTAPSPPGVTGGPVCYGPNVAAAATLLASTDVIGIERAADLMGALLNAPVSTGFVSRCLVRLDAALIAAGFEDALKDALRAADVLGTDETPAPLTSAATSAEGCGKPHQGGDHRVRDPGRLPRDPGPRRLRRLPQLRRRARRSPAVPGPPLPVPRRRLRDRSGIPGLDPAGQRRPPRGRRGGPGRPGRPPGQPGPRPAGHAAPQLRPGRRLRDLRQPVPALAQGQPPRPHPRQAAETQSQPDLAVRHPLRRPGHEQRIGERRPRLQARRQNQRLLAHPFNPAAPLPYPLLPHHRTQPRPPPPHRYPRRPHRKHLDATTSSMIN